MKFKRSIKRFAHVTGFTYVTYSDSGEIITSGASDGDIRIWKEIGDDDPTSQCVGEKANCCVQYTDSNDKKRLLAASESSVLAYKYPDFERDGVEFRFNSAVTSIKISDKFMAAGCEDSTIKVKKIDQPDDFIELKGHQGPILSVDLHSKQNQLAASSGDGSIHVWNLDKKEILKTFGGLTKSGDFSESKIFNTPVFEKTGRYMAFPTGKSISVVETSDWEVKFKLENSEVESEFSVCSFSHCGQYLAAGSTKGEISIWRMANKEVIKGETQGEDFHSVSAIEWNPKVKEEFAFVDLDGQLTTVTISLHKHHETTDDDMNGVEENVDPDDIYGGIDFHDDEADEDADNENCVALEKLKNETLKNGIDSDNEDMKSVISAKSYSPPPSYKKFTVQPPFQPGSTPDNLEHRFMVWNHVGQVMNHVSDEENSIIVEFHDTSVHSSMHLVNSLNHQLASLSTTCLALATKETPCKLVCIGLQAGSSREWSVTMPDCEEIVGIATADAFVAVVTNSDYIRLFTTMGTQREVISVPGPIVCTSAHENKLVVVYHTSETSNKYSIMIITILGLVISNRTVELPITPGSKLNWIGFSDTGSIISYESVGRVMSYNIKRNLWMPICDLTEHIIGASDNFFIVGVSERSQKIRATLCRGTSYPLTNPRPILREIDYCLPLCHMETEKSKLEEALVRSTAFEMESSEKSTVEKALKLFSTALNSELEVRAFEIVELIGEKKLIELAGKYATQKGRMHLTNKILKLLNDYEDKEAEKLSVANALEKDAKSYSEIYDKSTHSIQESLIPQSTPIIAPRPMISQKRANPFAKKSLDKGNLSLSALNHLTKKSIGYNESINNSDDENVPANNSSLLSNKSISKDTPRPGNFMQWFIANKEDLINDNPNATDGELMKIGKQVYKELTKSETPSQATGPLNKRKLELNEEGGASKLAKYGHVE